MKANKELWTGIGHFNLVYGLYVNIKRSQQFESKGTVPGASIAADPV